MAGEKHAMLVIGKLRKTHVFEGIKSLPYCYQAQNKSWVISEPFKEWVTEQDHNFHNQGEE